MYVFQNMPLQKDSPLYQRHLSVTKGTPFSADKNFTDIDEHHKQLAFICKIFMWKLI